MRLRHAGYGQNRPKVFGALLAVGGLAVVGVAGAGATGILGPSDQAAEGVQQEQLFHASEPNRTGPQEVVARGTTAGGQTYAITYQESDKGPCVGLSLDGRGGPEACGDMIEPGRHDVAMLRYGTAGSSEEIIFGITSSLVDNLRLTPDRAAATDVAAQAWSGHDRKFFLTSLPASWDGKSQAVQVAAREASGGVVEQHAVTVGGVRSAGSTPPVVRHEP
jgi:hypothetical protein